MVRHIIYRSNHLKVYHIDIECIWSYVLRIVFASIPRVALLSCLASSLKLIASVRVFGVGEILAEACW